VREDLARDELIEGRLAQLQPLGLLPVEALGLRLVVVEVVRVERRQLPVADHLAVHLRGVEALRPQIVHRGAEEEDEHADDQEEEDDDDGAVALLPQESEHGAGLAESFEISKGF